MSYSPSYLYSLGLIDKSTRIKTQRQVSEIEKNLLNGHLDIGAQKTDEMLANVGELTQINLYNYMKYGGDANFDDIVN